MVENGSDPSRCLALALDVDEIEEASALAASLRGQVAVVKVGLQLFCSAGPAVVRAMKEEGFDVFLDVKLHDIPNTVARAARNAGRLLPRYLTVHAAGGAEMLAAAVHAAGEASGGETGVLAVTVLTSEATATAEVVRARSRAAAEAGCAGVVCAASDLEVAAAAAPDLLRVVPGIRLPGSPSGDQKRTATPGEAIRLGADLLVIGRTVTAGGGEAGMRSVREDVAAALAGAR